MDCWLRSLSWRFRNIYIWEISALAVLWARPGRVVHIVTDGGVNLKKRLFTAPSFETSLHCSSGKGQLLSDIVYIVYENLFWYIILFLYVVTKRVWFAAHCAWLLCARCRDEDTFLMSYDSTLISPSTKYKRFFSHGSWSFFCFTFSTERSSQVHYSLQPLVCGNKNSSVFT